MEPQSTRSQAQNSAPRNCFLLKLSPLSSHALFLPKKAVKYVFRGERTEQRNKQVFKNTIIPASAHSQSSANTAKNERKLWYLYRKGVQLEWRCTKQNNLQNISPNPKKSEGERVPNAQAAVQAVCMGIHQHRTTFFVYLFSYFIPSFLQGARGKYVLDFIIMSTTKDKWWAQVFFMAF